MIHIFREKKAISPLVATALLIGFVVLVIVLIWIWSRNVYEERVEKEGVIAQEQIKCNGVAIELEPAGGTYYLRNTGTLAFYGFRVREELNNGLTHLSEVYTEVLIGETFPFTRTNQDCSEGSTPESPGALCGNTETVTIEPALQPTGRGAPLVPCSNGRVTFSLDS